MKSNHINSNRKDSFTWPYSINREIAFPKDYFELLINELGYELFEWIDYWINQNGDNIGSSYWSPGTKKDWIWGLGLPFLTEIKRSLSLDKEYILLGLSALPGCGKSRLGRWLESASSEMGLPVNVISLDDFYLPGDQLETAMSGNPWNVPRALPGSHSLEMMEESLEQWIATGILKAPTFDKSLRNGHGDRSGWRIVKPKVLVIEGWFLGCQPAINSKTINDLAIEKLTPALTKREISYREKVQKKLTRYVKIWNKIDRLWHIKPSDFNATCQWKIDQEHEMFKQKGSSLKGESLRSFVRMIQAAIPQQSLLNINSDVLIEIDKSRKILWAGNRKDLNSQKIQLSI